MNELARIFIMRRKFIMIFLFVSAVAFVIFFCVEKLPDTFLLFFFEFFLSNSPRIKICHFTYVNRLIYIFFFFFVSVILLWCDEQASHIPLYVQKQRKQQSKLAVHLRKITFHVRGRQRKSDIAHTVSTY